MNYIKFNYDYDRERLLKIFNDSKKAIIKGVYSVTENFSDDKSLDCLFMLLNKILRCEDNIGLSLIDSNIRPYISPGNNGLIIFPVRGCLEMSFYGYHKIDSSGVFIL